MNEADPSARPEAGPLPSEKILALSELLENREIPYAFGGAIALFYYRDPRSTIDIDVNIFLPTERQSEVAEALGTLYPIDAAKVSAEIEAAAQTRSLWGDTNVDLFFANTDFHTQMAERKRRQPFLGGEIDVLSAEDLLVCKMLFDRPKDWLDIEAVAQTIGPELDQPYIASALEMFVESTDARFDRWRTILGDEQR